MAYSNVGTPRFYVDYLLWLKTLGLPYIVPSENTAGFDSSILKSTISLNPSNQITLYNYELLEQKYIQLPAPPAIAHPTISGQNTRYFAVLGHNISSASSSINVHIEVGSNSPQNVVNLDTQYDGFSIGTDYNGLLTALTEGFDEVYRIYIANGTNNLKVGCYSVGNYYQMPHSPELKLTMTREMGDGVKRLRTKGGADLVNHKYTKPAMWGDAGAWELYTGTPENQELSRIGRRSWSLSFNYLQDSDLFPAVSHVSWEGSLNEDGDTYGAEDGKGTSLLESNDFYSQVINRTMGAGNLPFIFQPDSNNNNPDQFAICKFDMKEFKLDQVANGVYNVKLKIREVW